MVENRNGLIVDAEVFQSNGTAERDAAHPFYTPIARFGSEYVLEPVAYGLKFGEFSGASFL